MNDNHKPMSPLGRSLFDMMNGINQAYVAQREVERLGSLTKPAIMSPITRPSQKESPT